MRGQTANVNIGVDERPDQRGDCGKPKINEHSEGIRVRDGMGEEGFELRKGIGSGSAKKSESSDPPRPLFFGGQNARQPEDAGCVSHSVFKR